MATKKSVHGALTPAQLELVAARFRALGVPSRLRVLNALRDGAMGMGELAVATGMQQSNISRQVTELERAGCVERDRQGREVTVRIADPTLVELCDLVCGSLLRQAKQEHASLLGR